MNKNAIKLNLRRKIDHWLNSLDDINLREMCKDNIIVTGGSIVSLLNDLKVKDYDIYLKSNQTAEKLKKYYNEKKKSEGENFSKGEIENITPEDYSVQLITDNAISLNDGIQIITRFTGTPDEIHDNFDFEHCKNYYDYYNNKLVLNPNALESIITKTLYYNGSKYPLCSLFRLRKFLKRGWNITAGEMLKIGYDINELNFENTDVLKEHLTGVDFSSFQDVISQLNKDIETDNFKNYLFEIIDNVFYDYED